MPFFGGGGAYKIIGTNVTGSPTSLPTVTGVYNMALGIGAGQNVLTGSNNLLIGAGAGDFITTDNDFIVLDNSQAVPNAPLVNGGANAILIGGGFMRGGPVPTPRQYTIGNSVLIGWNINGSTVSGLPGALSQVVVVGSDVFAGNQSVVLGYAGQAGGNSIAIGYNAIAGNGSIAIGSNVNALDGEIIIGNGQATVVLGAYTITASSLLPAPAATGVIPYWNGAAWAYDSTDLYYLEATNTLHVGALAVQQAATQTCTVTNTSASGPTQGAGVVGYSDDGAATASGDRLAHYIGGGAYNATHSVYNAAGMTVFATEAWTATAGGAQIRLEVTPNGTHARQTAVIVDQDLSVAFAGQAKIGPNFSANNSVSGNQNVTSGTPTKVILTTVEFDTANAFSTANSRFQPTKPGYYRINAAIQAKSATNSITYVTIFIYKNGTQYKGINTEPNSVNTDSKIISTLVYLNGSTDYVELWANITGTTPYINGSSVTSWMDGSYEGS